MNNRVTAISYLKLIFWGALAVGIVFLISAVLISCKKSTEEPIPAPPIISSFSPTSGIAPDGGLSGTLITISGSNFSTVPAENEIKFNGTTATTNIASNTQLTASVPAGATTGKISVTTNGQTAISATDFVVFQSPTITTFSPTSGSVGVTVTISGTNFDSTPASNIVKFNNTVATVSASTTTQLITTVPASATTGKVTVTVNGQTATSATDFTVLFQPTISSFTPVYALPGASITVTGTNFSTATADNVVTINGVAAAVTTASATQLTVSVPANATTGKIAVTSTTLIATSTNDFEVLKDIPRTGLIAFYPFTENGNCTNNSALNFNFSLAEAPALVNDRHNRPSQAISFNGSSQYSEIMKEVIPGQPFTVSFWMDPGSLTLYDHEIISSYINNRGYEITLRRNDATLEYYVYTSHVGNAGLTYLSPTTSYLPAADAGNIWISIILTFDGSTYKVYKDGVEIISNPITPIIPLAPSSKLWIGGDEGKHFIGKLDDIVIYNRVLTAQELTQLFQQTVSKY